MSFLNGKRFKLSNTLLGGVEEEGADELLFHTNCGTYAQVINGGRTAHRPK